MSAVTDQPGTHDVARTSGDFDDDDGGGLVSNMFTVASILTNLQPISGRLNCYIKL